MYDLIELILMTVLGFVSVYNSLYDNLSEEKRAMYDKLHEMKFVQKLKRPQLLFKAWWGNLVYFNSKKIHESISESIESNSIFGIFTFLRGLFSLFFYYIYSGLLMWVVKFLISLILRIFLDFNTLEPSMSIAFYLMLGVGISSYFMWFKNLKAHTTKIQKNKRDMKIIKSMGSSMTFVIKIFLLYFVYGIWMMGDVFLLFLSPGLYSYSKIYYIGVVIYFIVIPFIVYAFDSITLENEENGENS